MTMGLEEIYIGKRKMSQDDVKERQKNKSPTNATATDKINVPAAAVCCFPAETFHRRGTKNLLSSHGCRGTQKGYFC